MNSKLVERTLPDLKTWPVRDFVELFELVQEMWAWENFIKISYPKSSLWNDIEMVVEISTGGWSDNEEIIYSLKDNTIFWMVAWYSSQRGGHYVFKIRPKSFGYLKVSEYCKENNISRMAIHKSPHLYDWIKISQNKNLIRKKEK